MVPTRKRFKKKIAKWLFIASILTIIFPVYLFYEAGIQHWGGLKLSEKGDFLAGALGPASLLILAAAFLLQSDELEMQHEELIATRETLNDQKTQLFRSAEEAEKQNLILKNQEIGMQWQISSAILYGLSVGIFNRFRHFAIIPGLTSSGHNEMREEIRKSMVSGQAFTGNFLNYIKIIRIRQARFPTYLLVGGMSEEDKIHKIREYHKETAAMAAAYVAKFSDFLRNLPDKSPTREVFESTAESFLAKELEKWSNITQYYTQNDGGNAEDQ
ncbi:hypothetical protein [Roseococcus thiosulfatophilus]|uniref:hypothetical protein n=1 Tax=Roseococcus thiosulfatophilus TaxID=35813 RepID=UPI001A8E2D8E|nr:hypothetical protein [Roseococcus thiosulfatophilus]